MDTPRPSPRTKWTRRVPHPVLIGHAHPRAAARRFSHPFKPLLLLAHTPGAADLPPLLASAVGDVLRPPLLTVCMAALPLLPLLIAISRAACHAEDTSEACDAARAAFNTLGGALLGVWALIGGGGYGAIFRPLAAVAPGSALLVLPAAGVLLAALPRLAIIAITGPAVAEQAARAAGTDRAELRALLARLFADLLRAPVESEGSDEEEWEDEAAEEAQADDGGGTDSAAPAEGEASVSVAGGRFGHGEEDERAGGLALAGAAEAVLPPSVVVAVLRHAWGRRLSAPLVAQALHYAGASEASEGWTEEHFVGLDFLAGADIQAPLPACLFGRSSGGGTCCYRASCAALGAGADGEQSRLELGVRWAGYLAAVLSVLLLLVVCAVPDCDGGVGVICGWESAVGAVQIVVFFVLLVEAAVLHLAPDAAPLLPLAPPFLFPPSPALLRAATLAVEAMLVIAAFAVGPSVSLYALPLARTPRLAFPPPRASCSPPQALSASVHSIRRSAARVGRWSDWQLFMGACLRGLDAVAPAMVMVLAAGYTVAGLAALSSECPAREPDAAEAAAYFLTPGAPGLPHAGMLGVGHLLFMMVLAADWHPHVAALLASLPGGAALWVTLLLLAFWTAATVVVFGVAVPLVLQVAAPPPPSASRVPGARQ